MNRYLRPALTWLGRLLGIAGIVFVFVRLRTHTAEIDLGRFVTGDWLVFSSLALLYGVSNGLLARAWQEILSHLGGRMTWLWTLDVYGVSQIAKYVPGNVFHLASRQALGMAAGLPGKVLAKSALMELAMLAFSGGMLGLLALPSIITILSPATGIGIYLGVFLSTYYLLRRLNFGRLAAALVWQSIFLMVAAFVFVQSLALVSDVSGSGVPLLLGSGAFILAWLAGFLTPGAPAGLGIREFVLIFLLSRQVPEADLLLAVVIGRLITLAGDTLFVLGTRMARRAHS